VFVSQLFRVCDKNNRVIYEKVNGFKLSVRGPFICGTFIRQTKSVFNDLGCCAQSKCPGGTSAEPSG
jgi:hypothetical protein